MVVDLSRPEGDMAMVLGEMQALNQRPIPIIFLSDTAEIETRLRAVRFGGGSIRASLNR